MYVTMEIMSLLTWLLLWIRFSVTETCRFGENCDYPCHCKNNAVCDVTTGSCPTGCDDGEIENSMDEDWYTGRWTNYGCQFGNVAYNKTAYQGPRTYRIYNASLAVDGNHNPHFVNGSCAHPQGQSWQLPWWQVDLGAIYVISSINITNRFNLRQQRRLENTDIDVSKYPEGENSYKRCLIIRNNPGYTFSGSCSRPLSGRYVRIRRRSWSFDQYQMNICEVQVYGYLYYACPNGTFGVACSTSCNCRAACDDVSGRCPDGDCQQGWFREDCQTALPRFNNTITVLSKNDTELVIRFAAWSRTIDAELMPAGYLVQWRAVDEETWLNDSQVQHTHVTVEYDVTIEGLQRGTAYFVRVWPYILERGVTYFGITPRKQGPHYTEGYTLPTLNNTVTLVSARNQSTLDIRFPAWSAATDAGVMPEGYLIQWRSEDSVTWTNQSRVEHVTNTTEYRVLIGGLQPETTYYIRVWPYIIDGGDTIYGDSPVEHGPFFTIGPPNQAAVIIAVVTVVLLASFLVVIIVVVLALRKKKEVKNGEGGSGSIVVNFVNDACVKQEAAHAYENHVMFTRNPREDNQVSAIYENDAHRRFSLPIPKKERDVCVNATKDDSSTYELCLNPILLDERQYYNHNPVGKPIGIDGLASYIDEMSKKRGGFKKEFEQIPAGVTATSEEGMKNLNLKRNRFKDIRAYDHSRVVLNVSPDDKGSTGYINANYIHKYKEEPGGYIAAQGPRSSTIADMWSMVWQTEANRVVMLTNLHEGGKAKCEQYWPDGRMVTFGNFRVRHVETQTFADYTVRTLSLIKTESGSRRVYHFHFTGWPDSGVPDMATALLNFRKKLRSYDDKASGPLIVHCSAGVGRTGTFLALDYLLDQAQAEAKVDVVRYTTLMRCNRINMIQTVAQYVFLYQALLEALQTGQTAIPAHEIDTRYPEMLQGDELRKQFEMLHYLKPVRNVGRQWAALQSANVNKNRDKHIIPSDKFRVRMAGKDEKIDSYINAVFVDGYRERHAHIATQLPLSLTVVNLWRMLYDHKCSCIIVLEQPDPDDENTPVYWPTEEGISLVADQITVTLLKQESLEEGMLNMMEFELAVSEEAAACRLSGIDYPFCTLQDSRTVRLYQFLAWLPDTETPPSPEITLTLLDLAQRWQLRAGHGPVVFQCKYGYERSGLMIAASYMLEKLKVDREVDVFQAVKQVRIPRSELVTSLAQYTFLHELAISFVQSCEDYANFK